LLRATCQTDRGISPTEPGISREDAKHTDWSTIVHLDDVEAAQRVWADCVASGRPFQMEFRTLRADGEYR
jgi:hypothetical protein